ncbi:MAG: prepilin-type N-terminal cleavage/methylation domain-containing protein [Gammaproteobacteria bacterium]|nr:prepilin-type N-terminal cleavage/methylation domain-containing protein [Gammaproteobacteria bacterium]MDD9897172.1 prepilin-type N-terminal cleavage/methylation domain-containing protein [Gammaproteobacteria bacterium]MDD9958101.1 prepilin-type N-terminal cleavage/methylation domain-containing protein [Gammaproteobacteria bacterium]
MNKGRFNRLRTQRGFTLLEVIVAMAITGFVLGSLFSLVGGSKQLSWRSEDSLHRATKARAVTNFALLQNEYRDVELILEDESWDIVAMDVLEEPERKTEPNIYTLQAFEIVNEERDEFITGNRWIRLNLPR